ncbi:MAG: hypothetical protein WHV28_04015 [Bacteroidota bacterium]
MPVLLFILLAFAINACDSPIDIQANREILDLRKNGDSIFAIIPDNVDLDDLLFGKSASISLKVENFSNKYLLLKEIIIKGNKNNYQFNNPVTLNLSPLSNDSFVLTINPSKFGYFTDTLFFREYFRPFLLTHYRVPHIFSSDLDFGNVQVGSMKLSTLNLYNFSSNEVFIDNFAIIGDSSVFKIENLSPKSFPLSIPANGTPRQLIVSFRPAALKKYEANFIFGFEVNNGAVVDNISKLVGNGI